MRGRRTVRSALVATALGFVTLAAAGGAAGTPPSGGTRALFNPYGVETYVDGEPSTQPAPDAPAGIDLRSLTVDVSGEHYLASLHFAGPYTPIDADQLTFVSLQPPVGQRQRISIDSRGRTTFWKAVGDVFQVVDGVIPVVTATGDHLDISLDAAGLSPDDIATWDWGIQAHVLAPTSGLHAHTVQGTLGALTGRGDAIALNGSGWALTGGRPVLTRAPQPLPSGLRLRQLAARSPGIIDLGLDAAPVDYRGRFVGTTPFAVASQRIGLRVSRSTGDRDPFVMAWSPAGATDGVRLDGASVRFTLPPDLLGPTTRFASVSRLPASAVAVPGTSLTKGAACPTNDQRFDVVLTVDGDRLDIAHGDGDIATGRLDAASGSASLTSPGARAYDLQLSPAALTGTHDFMGCRYDITITPASPLEVDTTVADPLVEAFVEVLDDNGNGLYTGGPTIDLDSIIAQTGLDDSPTTESSVTTSASTAPPAVSASTAEVPVAPVTDRAASPTVPPPTAAGSAAGGGRGNGLAIGGGVGALVVLAGGGLVVARRRRRPRGPGVGPPKQPTRTDPVTGMVWVCDANGRPIRPQFWVHRSDGTWGPPIGDELKMTARAEQRYQARAEMDANTTISQDVDDIEDPLRWFVARTSYDLLDTFSGGTLAKVEQQENLGTAQGWANAGVTGLWAVGDLASMGLSGRIKENMEAHAAELDDLLDVLDDPNASSDLKADAVLGIVNRLLDGVETGAGQAVVDLTPYDEIKVLRDPRATTEQQTKAALTAVSKVATLIAIGLGVRRAVRGPNKNTPPRGPRTPELNKGGVRPALEASGKNPELNKGGVRPALGAEADPAKTTPYGATDTTRLEMGPDNVPAYLEDPFDPAIDPRTGDVLPEESGVLDLDDPLSPETAQLLDPGRNAALDAKAMEVRGLDFDKQQATGMTPEQRAHYDAIRAADVQDLRTRPPELWDAIDDPQTRAYLEALRDHPF